jgi:hypothetical protein
MAVMPGQVCVDEVIRDDSCIRFERTGCCQNALSQATEPIVRDCHHQLHEVLVLPRWRRVIFLAADAPAFWEVIGGGPRPAGVRRL